MSPKCCLILDFGTFIVGAGPHPGFFPFFPPMRSHVVTLLLTGGKHHMCRALWRPKGLKGHSNLSATPYCPPPFLMLCQCVFVTLK